MYRWRQARRHRRGAGADQRRQRRSPQFKAAAAVLDQNSVDLAGAIESVYGEDAGKAFLDSWRKHIAFFVNYTLGSATGDDAMVKQAKQDLDGYRQDFGELLEGATEGILPAGAVADALKPHVRSTFKAIDATGAFAQGAPDGDPFVLLKEGREPHAGYRHGDLRSDRPAVPRRLLTHPTQTQKGRLPLGRPFGRAEGQLSCRQPSPIGAFGPERGSDGFGRAARTRKD